MSRLAAVFLFVASTAAAAPLEDARWTRKDADLVRLLTMSPGECLVPPATPDEDFVVEVGRAAFRTPFLFGGTAARAGLSCNSCHRDGRDNPDFFLESLSGAPGTADVTSSIFSKTREDGVFNPVVIPTLVDAAKKNSFGTSRPHGSIEAFVESAVDEEFGGAPPPSIAPAVAAYVAQLKTASCAQAPTVATPSGEINDVRRALDAARAAHARGDAATADFLLVAARGQLGRINERFVGDGLAGERAQLNDRSSELATLREMAKNPDAGILGIWFDMAYKRLDATAVALETAREKSLYEPAVLKRWLKEKK
jgi:hypothetical protein